MVIDECLKKSPSARRLAVICSVLYVLFITLVLL